MHTEAGPDGPTARRQPPATVRSAVGWTLKRRNSSQLSPQPSSGERRRTPDNPRSINELPAANNPLPFRFGAGVPNHKMPKSLVEGTSNVGAVAPSVRFPDLMRRDVWPRSRPAPSRLGRSSQQQRSDRSALGSQRQFRSTFRSSPAPAGRGANRGPAKAPLQVSAQS